MAAFLYLIVWVITYKPFFIWGVQFYTIGLNIYRKDICIWRKVVRFRSSHRRCSVKNGVLRNLRNFWEHLFLQKTSCGCFWNWFAGNGLSVFPSIAMRNSGIWNLLLTNLILICPISILFGYLTRRFFVFKLIRCSSKISSIKLLVRCFDVKCSELNLLFNSLLESQQYQKFQIPKIWFLASSRVTDLLMCRPYLSLCDSHMFSRKAWSKLEHVNR